MKKIILFAIVVLLFSCKQKKEEPKLKLGNFILANYNWYLHSPLPDTSWDFVLSKHISIQQNGIANIMYDKNND